MYYKFVILYLRNMPTNQFAYYIFGDRTKQENYIGLRFFLVVHIIFIVLFENARLYAYYWNYFLHLVTFCNITKFGAFSNKKFAENLGIKNKNDSDQYNYTIVDSFNKWFSLTIFHVWKMNSVNNSITRYSISWFIKVELFLPVMYSQNKS